MGAASGADRDGDDRQGELCPGETATLVIRARSGGRALAVVEKPEGRFRYDWVDIANGFGRYP